MIRRTCAATGLLLLLLVPTRPPLATAQACLGLPLFRAPNAVAGEVALHPRATLLTARLAREFGATWTGALDVQDASTEADATRAMIGIGTAAQVRLAVETVLTPFANAGVGWAQKRFRTVCRSEPGCGGSDFSEGLITLQAEAGLSARFGYLLAGVGARMILLESDPLLHLLPSAEDPMLLVVSVGTVF